MDSLYQIHRTSDDPFASVIEQFIITQFPGVKLSGTEPLLDLLTKAFVSSNNVRFGPAPNPESLVAIRAAIRANIEEGLPIPILVPWGGRKARKEFGIDIAELSALKQIHSLCERVREFYQPGITVNIRVEDVNALYLYQDEGEAGLAATEKYSHEFSLLTHILGLDFIHPIREVSMLDKEEYFRVADEIKTPMKEYLMGVELGSGRSALASWQELSRLGWKGEIPKEQREYYKSRYRASNPDMTDADMLDKMASYFAGSLARYKLNAVGNDVSWGNNFIRLIFVPAVPGAPTGLVDRNLYYRTVPEKMSRSHMPAWRSRGYLLIKGDKVSAKLINFHDPIELIPHWTTLSRNGQSVDVETSYRLED